VFKSTCIALVLLFPAIAVAQKKEPAPSSTIILQLPGLNCSTAAGQGTFKVLAWSWGASNSGTVLGGAGKANLQDLSVTKLFDGCSPAILGAVTTGAFLKSATLTQVGGADVNKTTTIRLNGVQLSSWSLGSTINEEAPSENLSLNFTEICITDTASGAREVCYDAAENRLQ
jgi:type VI secretion system secreted protein Hcp